MPPSVQASAQHTAHTWPEVRPLRPPLFETEAASTHNQRPRTHATWAVSLQRVRKAASGPLMDSTHGLRGHGRNTLIKTLQRLLRRCEHIARWAVEIERRDHSREKGDAPKRYGPA